MFRFTVLIAVLLLALSSCKTAVVYEVSDPVYKTGDNPAWATNTFDSKGWAKERGQTGTRVFWGRSDVSISKVLTTEHLGIEVHAFGAFEVFWDGHKIGENGRISGGIWSCPVRKKVIF
jgi:hypothetical protein